MFPTALLLVLTTAPVTSLPPLTAYERSLAAHARDGRLEGTTLLDAALLASGVPEAAIAGEAKRVRAALAPAVARARTQQGEAARGKMLLQALHETVLRRYELGATELNQVVRTGEFNCLSSALLYLVAAEGVLTSARGVVTPLHAFVRVTVEGKTVDVETTSPAGFDPDRSKLTTAQVRQIAGEDVSPDAFREGLKQVEELPSLSLVAAVYSNRAIALARRGDTAGAALALDRGARMATGALLERLADWRASLLSKGAKDLVDLGRYDDARRLLELGLEVTEGSHRALLTKGLSIVHHHLGLAAAERKDWTVALAEAETAERLGLRNEALAQLKTESQAQLAVLEGSAARCHAEGLAARSPGAKEAAACLAALAGELLERDTSSALQYARRALQLAPRGRAGGGGHRLRARSPGAHGVGGGALRAGRGAGVRGNAACPGVGAAEVGRRAAGGSVLGEPLARRLRRVEVGHGGARAEPGEAVSPRGPGADAEPRARGGEPRHRAGQPGRVRRGAAPPGGGGARRAGAAGEGERDAGQLRRPARHPGGQRG